MDLFIGFMRRGKASSLRNIILFNTKVSDNNCYIFDILSLRFLSNIRRGELEMKYTLIGRIEGLISTHQQHPQIKSKRNVIFYVLSEPLPRARHRDRLKLPISKTGE